MESGDGNMTAMEGRCGAPVHVSNDGDELGEVFHFVGSAHGRKHIVGQVIDVVPHPVVGIQECLHILLNALDHVRMSKQCRM